MTKLKTLLAATTVGLLFVSQTSVAAIEIDDNAFGPSYETMVVDTAVGKPLQLIAAVGGTAAYVASYPFAYVAGNVDQSKQKLFDEPWQAMSRCLGCTVSEDAYYDARKYNQNAVRFVTNGPSEVLINTNDNVVINDYAGVVSE